MSSVALTSPNSARVASRGSKISPEQDARISTPEHGHVDKRMVLLAIFVLAVQRVALPAGVAVPFSALIVLIVVLFNLGRGHWVIGPLRLVALLGFLGSAMVTLAATWNGWEMASALAYVLLLWLPVLALNRSGNQGGEARSFAFGVVAVTSVAGYVGAVQSFATLAGATFFDPLALLPPELRVPGYRSAQTVSYGGSWYKANGLIFLEPSFLSLISAVALLLIAAGFVRARARTTALAVAGLVLGLLASGAISGVLVLPVVFLALLRSGRTIALAISGVVAIAVAAVATPIAQSFIERLLFRQGSNDARLTRPYEQLLPEWYEGPLWLGHGPGEARVLADQLTAGSWETEVTTPTLVKLLFEYGLIGAFTFSALVGLVLISSSAPLIVKVGLLVTLTVPTDGLASHVIVPLFLFLLMGSASAVEREMIPSRIGKLYRWST